MSFAWMAWTLPTALFFLAVAAALATLTWLELRFPTRLRRGWLPLATTRGDRFFISLLTAAFVHVLWISLTDAPVPWATGASLVIGAGLMRWG
jgi:predicted small integral membrane protein